MEVIKSHSNISQSISGGSGSVIIALVESESVSEDEGSTSKLSDRCPAILPLAYAGTRGVIITSPLPINNPKLIVARARFLTFSLTPPPSTNTNIVDNTTTTTTIMATPARSTRARSRQNTPQPLPAVDVRTSHTYGSRGRANLQNQLAAAGTTLADAFATGRAGAGIAPVLEESVEDEEELLMQPPRQGTVVDSMAQYEGSDRNSMPPPPRPAAARARPVAAASSPPPPPPAEPWTLSVLLLAIPRYLWRNFWALIVGGILLFTFAHITLPEKASLRRDEVVRGVKIAAGLPGYDQPPGYLEALWMHVKYNSTLVEDFEGLEEMRDPVLQHMVNTRLRQLIRDVEGNVTATAERLSAVEAYIPPRMVVDLVDGEMVIREDFWHALSSKLEGSDTLYNAFAATQADLVEEIASEKVDKYMSSAYEDKRILGRVAIMELLDDNNKNLEQKMSALVEARTSEALVAARAIAAEVAQQVAENTPSDARAQLSLLAKTNLVMNHYEVISSVNHFSARADAIVDPHQSSQTALKSWKDPKVGWFGNSLKRPGLPPINALASWEEMGDCWCAAKTPDMGQLQLAVITQHKILPRHLVVEHIPAKGTRNIRSAPQDFELWAELFSAEQAEELKQYLRRHNPRYDNECNTEPAPSKTSVCIATGSYNIHAENWVQSVPMLADLEKYPSIGANKFYFRALSNWGGKQTCIYRLRLTGSETEGGADAFPKNEAGD